jgi:hypothetical protein
MIDESKYAFGLDGSRYWSTNSFPDWQVMANYKPYVRFIAFRKAISWGYTDSFFNYHWEQLSTLHQLREEETLPVGRLAYHVLYPGEDVQRQADNWFRDLQADWTHDRLVIDAELDHGQSRQRITYAINTMGEICRSRTGMLPLLYARYYWLRDFTYPDALLNFDHWLAQYRLPYAFPAFTPEREPPPNPTFGHWLITQTGDKGDADMFGVYGKHYIDRDRWNGGSDAVAAYFQFEKEEPSVPATIEERVELLEVDSKMLKQRVAILEETIN